MPSLPLGSRAAHRTTGSHLSADPGAQSVVVRLDRREKQPEWDAGPDPELNELVAEAALELGVAHVYVTLVGEQRLTYAAKPPGDPEDGRPLHRSHCQEVVRSGRSFVVTGATSDEALDPAGGPPVAYAGSPIAVEGGTVVGGGRPPQAGGWLAATSRATSMAWVSSSTFVSSS